jgi:2,3-bisphosphoglycerate-dependent phosphoglycerate mutase
MARTLWLVRHGESTWNRLGLAQGHRDEAELTSQGVHQAWAVAGQLRNLRVGALYASDLRRARQTAAPLASVLSVPVRLDPRLRERSLGVLEGGAASEVSPQMSGLAGGRVTAPDARPAGGESVRDLYRRAAAFAGDLAALAAGGDLPPGDIVVVAHGGTVRVLHAHMSGIAVEDMEWAPLHNATIIRISRWTGTNSATAREGSKHEPYSPTPAPTGGQTPANGTHHGDRRRDTAVTVH